ncbi:MAG: ribbon-helix-helix domain-containing protein [Hyphomicrobiaceae bacterium]|uniref:ribbon-helix-helix domain-containing protein n=1 Tax=Bradyrhizobium sp. TaxID=376 RepID=UPI003D0B4813
MSTPERVNKLKAAMQGMAGVPEPQATPPPVRAVEPVRSETSATTTLAPSRRGKRNVSAYIDATAAKQLRLLAVERDASTQGLIEEALNDLFRKYNKSPIA